MKNRRKILCGLLTIAFLSASFCCHSMVMAEDRNILSVDSHRDTPRGEPHACCPLTSGEDHKKCHCRGELPALQPEKVKKQGGDEFSGIKYFPLNFSVRLTDDWGIDDLMSSRSHLIDTVIHKPGPIYLVDRVLRL